MCLRQSDDTAPATDAEWTAALRAAAGTPAFGDLFAAWLKRHTHWLMRGCRALARGQKQFDRHTAGEELFGEVCLFALVRLPKALTRADKPVRTLKGYVSSTCLRAAYEKLKFRVRNRSATRADVTTERYSDLEAEGRSTDHPAHHLPPDLHAEREELAAHARQAVAALDPPLRALVALHYYDGLSLGKIARRHGVPLGTLKERHKRVKELLGDDLWWLADEPVLVG